jgi:hypothetical protein
LAYSQYATPYFRFNVQEGLEEMMLDEWVDKKRPSLLDEQGRPAKASAIEYLDEVTRFYLDSSVQDSIRDPEVPAKESIERCAKVLVDYRRARRRIGMNGNAPG